MFSSFNETISSDNQTLIARNTILVRWSAVQMGIFLIVGLFGNTLLVLVFIDKKRKAKRNPHKPFTNHSLLTLAVVDALVLLFCTPIYSSHMLGVVVDDVSCKVVQFIANFVSMLATLALFVAVPLERVSAIYSLSNPRLRPSPGRANKVLVILIFVSAAIALPIAIWSSVSIRRYEHLTCDIQNEYRRLWVILNMGISSFSIVFMVVSYTIILIKVWKIKRELHELTIAAEDEKRAASTPGDKNRRGSSFAQEFAQRMRVVWMLFAAAVVFMLSWTPFVISRIWGGVLEDNAILQCLHLVNNATNFIVYGLINPSLRKDMLKKLLSIKHCLKKRTMKQTQEKSGQSRGTLEATTVNATRDSENTW